MFGAAGPATARPSTSNGPQLSLQPALNWDAVRRLTEGTVKIIRAARAGDFEAVENLVKSAQNPDEVLQLVNAGVTSISLYCNQLESAGENDTPLIVAAYRGDVRLISFLLEKGALVDGMRGDGFVPLHAACRHGQLKAVEKLLASGADAQGRSSIAKCGVAPLHMAVGGHSGEAVVLLLAAGADVNAKRRDDTTPFLLATALNDMTSMELLLAAGADISLPDNRGHTPLNAACLEANLDSVRLLLHAGANPHVPGVRRYTSLMSVCESVQTNFARPQREAIALWLIASGVSLDAEGADSVTALILASVHGFTGLVELLLDHGANPRKCTSSKELTPLHLAADRAHTAIVTLLLRAGAIVDARDISRATPLLLAARKSHTSVIELLLAAGADVDAQSGEGESPAQLLGLKGVAKDSTHADIGQVAGLV